MKKAAGRPKDSEPTEPATYNLTLEQISWLKTQASMTHISASKKLRILLKQTMNNGVQNENPEK